MTDAYKVAQSVLRLNTKRARHPLRQLDVYMLDLEKQTWHNPIDQYPRLNGPAPSSRAFFGACCMGRHILVLGGSCPTALTLTPVDQRTYDDNHKNDDPGDSVLFVFDTVTHCWSQPQPVNSAQYLQECVRLSKADCVRARETVRSENMRAVSLGMRLFGMSASCD
jgi:hypothetical protein